MKKLHTKHLEDLQKSGLSDETIQQAGIRSVTVEEMSEKLGFEMSGIESAYEIPYPGTDFPRFKVFYAENSSKKRPKYLQRRGSGNHLYFPPQVQDILSDPTIPLYITEGEKKALKACQEDIPCIGLSGLWNWSDGNKELISDFDKIALQDREVYIVPDSDWQDTNKHGYNKNLVQAVYSLANKLKERGSKVFIVNLNERSKENEDRIR